MNEEAEIWKPIAGFEGYYEVSNFGNVRGLDRVVSGRRGCAFPVKGKILKPVKNNHGYVCIRLCKGRKAAHVIALHRIVAKTFLPNPDNFPAVDHIDGDKNNNAATNLEWVTHKENVARAYRLGLIPSMKGENRKFNILKESDIPIIRSLRGTVSLRALGLRYGVKPVTIHAVMQRRSWAHIP